jgi:hypothetical protein
MKIYSGNRVRRIAGQAVGISLLLANCAFGQSSACDLDASGGVNVVDVNRAVSMALGTTPCVAAVEGPNTCTIVTVQRVVNSALGQPCVTYNAATRSVALTWLPSPTAGVTGYNVYRRTTPTGVPVKLNAALIAGTTYTDTTVQLGTTYYYSATSVGAGGLESAESPQATAVIPAG